jgi:sulfite dehydrogenase (quinone) subunit SoeC
MWRTSWLSREVIVLPAIMLTVFLYGVMHYFGWHTATGSVAAKAAAITGGIGVILCFALFVCTGMIYACIRFLQEWAGPLTLINYFLLGCASGFILATAFAFFTAPDLVRIYGITAILFMLAALIGRTASLYPQCPDQTQIDIANGDRHSSSAHRAKGPRGNGVGHSTRASFSMARERNSCGP